jgi:hypothetical protein
MPPDLTTNISTVYLTQGVLGASCIVLALVILKLWGARETDRLKHEANIAAKDALINELQEQRLTEALASRDVIRTIQTTLEAFLQAVRGKGMQ